MYLSIFSILLTLGGKCLLNLILVFLQRKLLSRSFLGVFSVSVVVVDVALTLTAVYIHIYSHEYVSLFGYLMTQYDVCLLVQISGQISRLLQWPIVALALVDHFYTVTQTSKATTSSPALVRYFYATLSLWFLAALYIFLLPDLIPDISKPDVLRCRIIQSFNVLHITLLLLLLLACLLVFSLISPVLKKHAAGQSQIPTWRSFVQQTLKKCLHSWIPFLVFLAVLSPVGIPSYLDLNVAWLCFVNSLLVAVVLCAVCPSSQPSQDLAAVLSVTEDFSLFQPFHAE